MATVDIDSEDYPWRSDNQCTLWKKANWTKRRSKREYWPNEHEAVGEGIAGMESMELLWDDISDF